MSHPALLPGYRFVTPEVLYGASGFVTVGDEQIAMLKAIAAGTPRRRARVCCHPDPSATQQEMIIVMHGSGYVRPHRHFGKSETLLVLEGAVSAVLWTASSPWPRLVRVRPFSIACRWSAIMA